MKRVFVVTHTGKYEGDNMSIKLFEHKEDAIVEYNRVVAGYDKLYSRHPRVNTVRFRTEFLTAGVTTVVKMREKKVL